jgi:hypothetical protein
MKYIKLYEDFINKAYKDIPHNVKIAGKYEITIDGKTVSTSVAGFERENDDSDSLYFMDEDKLRDTIGTLIVKNSDMPKLQKGTTVKAIGSKNNKEVKIKRIGDIFESFLNEAKDTYKLRDLIGKEFDGIDVGSQQPRSCKVLSVNGPKGEEIKIEWTDVRTGKTADYSIEDFEYMAMIKINENLSEGRISFKGKNTNDLYRIVKDDPRSMVSVNGKLYSILDPDEMRSDLQNDTTLVYDEEGGEQEVKISDIEFIEI